jgi:hypothetical protein
MARIQPFEAGGEQMLAAIDTEDRRTMDRRNAHEGAELAYY